MTEELTPQEEAKKELYQALEDLGLCKCAKPYVEYWPEGKRPKYKGPNKEQDKTNWLLQQKLICSECNNLMQINHYQCSQELLAKYIKEHTNPQEDGGTKGK